MKALDIALKDLLRSFRSTTALVFMFVVPLLVTALFHFMFGSIGGGGGFDVPQTAVVVANLDRGGPAFGANLAGLAGAADAASLGDLAVGVLEDPALADMLAVSRAGDAEAARAAVDRGEAGVAVVIPPDFSARFAEGSRAEIELYRDPSQTIGPEIVRAVLVQITDGFSAAAIAAAAAAGLAGPGEAEAAAGQALAGYLAAAQAATRDPAALLELVRPRTASAGDNLLLRVIGPIMGGMMIFYAFYTGAATAQSILQEEDERTLPRLFTTPTPQAAILSGKFLAVFLTVLVQVTVLLVAARFIFGIRWGAILPVALVAAGTVLAASTFGILLNSLLKSTRQSGGIFGGVLTITGMVGMMPVFTGTLPTAPGAINTIALLFPQGWAMRGLLQSMHSLPLADVLVTAAVLLALSVLFFSLGVWRFRRRYA